MLLLFSSALSDKTQDLSEAAAGMAAGGEEALLKASKDSLELLAFAKEYIATNKLEAVQNEDVVGVLANVTDVTNRYCFNGIDSTYPNELCHIRMGRMIQLYTWYSVE
jgi:hypothetical protein